MKQLINRGLILFLAAVMAFAPIAHAAQQTINRGTTAGDGTGETLYSAFGKVNRNFGELYIGKVTGLTAGNLGAAAANTAALQAALDTGGLVSVDKPGDYYVNRLTIRSNTRLVSAPGVHYILATTNSNMLVNAAYLASTTPVTVSWTSGATATVTWTGHNLIEGDYISLSGMLPSAFNGVFQVLSVTDPNNVVVELVRTPFASPTGSAVAKKADVNITIDGGTWDYNYPTNSGTLDVNKHAIIIGHVAGLTARNIRGRHVQKFVFHVGAARDVFGENIGADDTSSDIVKNYGPLFNAHYRNINGKALDDVISFQTKEADVYAGYRWTYGDIINAGVDGVSASSEIAMVAAVYGSTDEYMGGIALRNVGGKAGSNGIKLVSVFAGGKIDSVSIENVSAVSNYQVHVEGSITIDRVMINGQSFNPSATNAVAYLQDSTATVKSLQINGFVLNNALWTGSSYVASIGGVVDTFRIGAGTLVSGSTGRLVTLLAGSACKKLTIDGFRQETGDNMVVVASGVTNTPDISITNSDIKTTAVVNASSSANINLSGNRIESASNGVLRTGGTPTIKMHASGNTLVSGSWVAVPSGTPVISLSGADITGGKLALALSDANTTLTYDQPFNAILEFTGTLSAQRNLVLPLTARQYTVYNNTTGGFGLQFIGATGTGVVVGAGKRALIYADGTNIVRVTADQ